MSDSIPVDPAGEKQLVCPECGSSEVRSSKSSYPLDKQRLNDGNESFWRCGNCGSRFMGPRSADAPAKRRGRGHERGDKNSALDRRVQFGRKMKRWVFPIAVILLTVVAVVYLLDRRDPAQPPNLISPD